MHRGFDMRKGIKIVSNCFIGLLILLLIFIMIIGLFSKDSIVKFGNYSFFEIRGNSMYPELKDGDLIAVNRDIKDIYEKDDIICYYSIVEDKVIIIAHKVVDVYIDGSNILYLTEGVNNPNYDEELINHSEVIGEYKNFRVPLLGHVVRISNTKWGYLCLVVLPLGVMSTLVIYELMKEISKNKGEK